MWKTVHNLLQAVLAVEAVHSLHAKIWATETIDWVYIFPQNRANSRRAQIGLELDKWAALLQTSVETVDDQRSRIRRLLTFFIEMGCKNNLGEAPAVIILKKCLNALGEKGEFVGNPRSDWRYRICQRTIDELEGDMRSLSRELDLLQDGTETNHITQSYSPSPLRLELSPRALDAEVPLFNMWDAMSFIYTTCVEPIYDQLSTELHLYQFWTIVQVIKACRYFANIATPRTAAAAWADTGSPDGFVVAFATTCVCPKGGNDKSKKEMADMRCRFISRLQGVLNSRHAVFFFRGNCPEFWTWGWVCNRAGKYKSLCFGREGEGSKSMKFCEYCEEQATFLRSHGIDICYLWMQAELCDKDIPPKFDGLFPYRLLEPMNKIVNRVNRHKNH